MYGTNYTYKIWDYNVRNLWKAWNANPIDGKRRRDSGQPLYGLYVYTFYILHSKSAISIYIYL